MVGKIMKIGLLVVLAALSFGISFVITGHFKPAPPEQTAANQTTQSEPERFDLEKELLGEMASAEESEMTPKEKQLDELINDVRTKLQQLERRERDIEEREKRLSMANEHLKKQSEEIRNLCVELTAALTPLKAAKEDLLSSRAMITAQEVANLQSVAKTYAKMDPANAARIILEMFKSKQEKQAVKIIHFLPEKSWAAIMDEIKESDMAAEIIKKQLKVINNDGKS